MQRFCMLQMLHILDVDLLWVICRKPLDGLGTTSENADYINSLRISAHWTSLGEPYIDSVADGCGFAASPYGQLRGVAINDGRTFWERLVNGIAERDFFLVGR